ncbi:MAG: hypothetical protein GF311_21920 [Candidatus Lokiarchaeota archaeon]|nr:hypothetical protein [Candidatus Lokiarchaeota archaeon]
MFKSKMSMDLTEKALNNFDNIKEAIKGIYEIFKITLPDKDCYFKLGVDNITALYQNILELASNETGLKEIMEKVQNSEIELDIPLDI